MRYGLIIVLIGLLFLLKNLGLLEAISWNILWPLVLIVVGLGLVGRRCRHCDHCKDGKCNSWMGNCCHKGTCAHDHTHR